MNAGYSLTQDELEFFASRLRPTDRAWEWGSGLTTRLLAQRCRSVTTVDHLPVFAARACLDMLPRTSVLYIPPDMPFDDARGDDGDGDTFRSYVNSYTGHGVNVVLIDGRARVACARHVAETAQYGPTPDMRIFLHDAERAEYAPIFLRTDTSGTRVSGWLAERDRVGRLSLLGAP